MKYKVEQSKKTAASCNTYDIIAAKFIVIDVSIMAEGKKLDIEIGYPRPSQINSLQ